MSRFDDILKRNRQNAAFSERNLTSLLFGAFLLLIIALAAFTKLGQAHVDPPQPPSPDEHRIDNVLLRHAHKP